MSEETKKYMIKDWSSEERPREKLLLKGPEALTNAELIAILIGSGSGKLTAVDLGRELLKMCHDKLSLLKQQSFTELCQVKGIGEAKAITIKAAFELNRRLSLEEGQQLIKISSSNDAYKILVPYLGHLKVEQFWVLLLNQANKVLAKHNISQGGITATVVDPKIVFQIALKENATSIILAHNHPSGNLKPSQADISLTEKLKKAGEFLDLKVLDHLIVTQSDYYSFADEGKL